MDAEGLCKTTEESNIWLSPFFLVSLTFIMIGLMALVYLLYQVMGESFVKADLFLREGLVLVMAKMRRRGTLLRICPRRLQVLRTSLRGGRPNRFKMD